MAKHSSSHKYCKRISEHIFRIKVKCLLIQPQSGASQTLWLPAAHLHNALPATLFDCFSHNATNLRNSWSSFLSPSRSFSLTSLIFFNNSHLYNYVLAIFWLQHIERRLRFFVQQIYLFDKMKYNKARQNRTFAKRYLERDDCSARSEAQAERVNFCG